jgi:SEC-C motif
LIFDYFRTIAASKNKQKMQDEVYREAKTFQTIVNIETTKAPKFQHPEIEQLYKYNIDDLPTSIQNQIIELPRASLIADLEMAVRDTRFRAQFFFDDETNETEDGTAFGIHAIRFLGYLNSEESLQTILDLFRMDEAFLDFWFGDFSNQTCQATFFALGQPQFPALAAFVREPNVHAQGKEVVILAVAQIALQKPERRAECVAWLTDLFDFFLENESNENLMDSFVITHFIEAAISLRETRFLPQIKRALDLKVMPEDMMGDFADIKKAIEKPWGEWEITPMPQNLAEYFDDSCQERKLPNPEMEAFMERLHEHSMFSKNLKDKRIFRPVAEKSPLFKNVGRNDPCPCGSGKKFKKCCGA